MIKYKHVCTHFIGINVITICMLHCSFNEHRDSVTIRCIVTEKRLGLWANRSISLVSGGWIYRPYLHISIRSPIMHWEQTKPGLAIRFLSRSTVWSNSLRHLNKFRCKLQSSYWVYKEFKHLKLTLHVVFYLSKFSWACCWQQCNIFKLYNVRSCHHANIYLRKIKNMFHVAYIMMTLK